MSKHGTWECTYCGCTGGPHEQDHFPIPKHLGGTEVIDVCRGCHDMKDRMLMMDWNATEAFEALMSLWTGANRFQRIVIAKMVTIAMESKHILAEYERLSLAESLQS